MSPCKISGKIEFSHHIFVVAFSYAGNKEEAPPKRGKRSIICELLKFTKFSNSVKTFTG